MMSADLSGGTVPPLHGSRSDAQRAHAINLSTLLRQTARRFPDLPGLIRGGQQRSWREIDQRVDAMVNALRRRGVQKGDRILVQSANSMALAESCWVAFRLGCVWVPTNFRLTPPEMAFLGRSSGATVMMAETRFAGHVSAVRETGGPLAHEIWFDGETDDSYEAMISAHLGEFASEEVVAPGDPLWFFYTSGTTGAPKAGILTHGQMAFVVTNHLADLIPDTTHLDRSIAVAPLSHGAGIHMLLNVARGAPTVLLPGDKLDVEEVWKLIEQHRVSNLFTHGLYCLNYSSYIFVSHFRVNR